VLARRLQNHPSAAKAAVSVAVLLARLKSCPFKTVLAGADYEDLLNVISAWHWSMPFLVVVSGVLPNRFEELPSARENPRRTVVAMFINSCHYVKRLVAEECKQIRSDSHLAPGFAGSGNPENILATSSTNLKPAGFVRCRAEHWLPVAKKFDLRSRNSVTPFVSHVTLNSREMKRLLNGELRIHWRDQRACERKSSAQKIAEPKAPLF
jgi:hypothetical protein